RWPREAERLAHNATVWRLPVSGGPVRLLAQPGSAETGTQVFFVGHSAAVTDGQRWAHEASYLLRSPKGTRLQVVLPRGARIVQVLVNEDSVSPRLFGPDELWLPLPEGVHRLLLRWRFDEDVERLVRPNLERPRLQGVSEAGAVWTIHAPAGYRADEAPSGSQAASAGRSRSTSATGLALRRAD